MVVDRTVPDRRLRRLRTTLGIPSVWHSRTRRSLTGSALRPEARPPLRSTSGFIGAFIARIQPRRKQQYVERAEGHSSLGPDEELGHHQRGALASIRFASWTTTSLIRSRRSFNPIAFGGRRPSRQRAGNAQRRDDHESTSRHAVQSNMNRAQSGSAMTSPRHKIRKRIRTKAGLMTNSSAVGVVGRVPNMPLNLTKSPIRWRAFERCPTGAFAG